MVNTESNTSDGAVDFTQHGKMLRSHPLFSANVMELILDFRFYDTDGFMSNCLWALCVCNKKIMYPEKLLIL